MRVAVAGGTGVVGRHVVDALHERGHEAVVLSRSAGIDVASGTGLEAALEGVTAVVDALNVATTRRAVAQEFYEAATGRLARTGLPLVVLSIVGVDRVPFGYYQGKLAQEAVALRGPATTVLRATQFHEFARQVVDRGYGPVVPVPRMRSQPVAAREVAAHLVDLVADPPGGQAPELAGPRVEDVVAMVRRVVRQVARRTLVLPLTLPGETGRRMRDGGLLPQHDGPRGVQTFDDWLADQAATRPAAERSW